MATHCHLPQGHRRFPFKLGVPTCSPPSDLSSAPRRDAASMHTKPFSSFCAADQCSRRVEQILLRKPLSRKIKLGIGSALGIDLYVAMTPDATLCCKEPHSTSGRRKRRRRRAPWRDYFQCRKGERGVIETAHNPYRPFARLRQRQSSRVLAPSLARSGTRLRCESSSRSRLNARPQSGK